MLSKYDAAGILLNNVYIFGPLFFIFFVIGLGVMRLVTFISGIIYLFIGAKRRSE